MIFCKTPFPVHYKLIAQYQKSRKDLSLSNGTKKDSLSS
jgi:Trk-type K+ transport system membrane component